MYIGLSEPQSWVLPAMLEEQSRLRPGAPWITVIGGERTTFGDAWLEVRRVATWFERRGVAPGDHVALMLPNGLDLVRAWLALGSLGAIAVLLNTELHGRFLEHQLNDCKARMAIVGSALVEAVLRAAGAAPELRRVAICGQDLNDTQTKPGHLESLPWSGTNGWRSETPWQGALPQAHKLFSIMYTSGTTGPAKGVLMPHAHCAIFAIGAATCALQLSSSDRYYITLPLFHANGLLMQLAATLVAGIPAIVRERFSASNWLADIRHHGATVTNTLGALSAFVLAQPPSPLDREHSLRVVVNAPNIADHDAAFRRRFGVQDVVAAYGMTEMGIAIWGRLGEAHPGAAGWVYEEHFELIIADPETDRECARGVVGEILVRPKTPWAFMQGYYGMPSSTVEAWRNLWFHTGDAALMDESGLVTFVDRLKDCIRRRAENISAAEVEAVVATIAGVAEVAAYAVPSTLAGGEDEVMLAIVIAEGAALDAATVLRKAATGLPRFAQPRYLRFVAELPKTSTGKVQRAVLRRAGAADAFDRERHSELDSPTP